MININVNEKELYKNHPSILELLLIDNTTKKNIIWATDSYKKRGYRFDNNIDVYSVTKSSVIIPRSKKAKAEQTKRSKDSAEVFTPSWMCNKQNNQIDNIWFKRENVFNIETANGWITNNDKIQFPDGKTWIDYICDIRLEISCGEAPYLVSRYDTVTGNVIPINERIGLLDRKFRVINENCDNKEDWIKYSILAVKSIYGYEWQGDNLLLARENVLFTYVDYYKEKFNDDPDEKLLVEITTIISWNLWQMDGIKGVIPNTCQKQTISQINLFGEEIIEEYGCEGCAKGLIHRHNGVYAKIMDWEKNKKIRFIDTMKGAF